MVEESRILVDAARCYVHRQTLLDFSVAIFLSREECVLRNHRIFYACTNSGYQAPPPPNWSLGTRLIGSKVDVMLMPIISFAI